VNGSIKESDIPTWLRSESDAFADLQAVTGRLFDGCWNSSPRTGFGMEIANKSRMAHGTVVLLGSLPIERLVLDRLVSEFGFSFKEAERLESVQNLNASDEVVAVFFSPSGLGLPWDEALRSVLNAFPTALPILCHGFADDVDWPEMADAGAFHSIPVPFSVAELRQSLGFVWGAKQSSKLMRSRTAAKERVPPARVVAAGIVA